MYEYHPPEKSAKEFPLYSESNSWERKGKRTKFQFFNSSEKRFKNLDSYGNIKS